jgi:predicted site-specific integrase-resolvase
VCRHSPDDDLIDICAIRAGARALIKNSEIQRLFRCINEVHIQIMKYGYARVSTDSQSVEAQVRQLTKAGCKKVFRETASGAKTDRSQLRKALDKLDTGDVLMVTKLDRLTRSSIGCRVAI